ncbi:uncharacterized protein LAESUDRAFT_653709 [Laetiporus sulphureus 93-53]|uniref:DUF7702 domain-containing protein n=1 Tax=Laetiporus sulphureus 93-53 TaxID=1314785 RepID=A0A165E5A7_9APHY|nr:uncharacterized protein LAESUDRAFT_653709 [Laetiporus sulphureus 93-53]KZT06263.1 hypothetical protein LAESUDRAFT_653709 [Laetiporus sulphureus 93-53]
MVALAGRDSELAVRSHYFQPWHYHVSDATATTDSSSKWTFDARGDIAIAELVVYVPVLVVALMLVLRHGLARRAGWVFLVILSIIRIIGAATNIASERDGNSDKTLIIIYSVMEASGVSPLLLATAGFLQTACADSLDDQPLVARALRLMSLLGTVALALAIAGGVTAGQATTESSLTQGTNLRHIGDILFVVLFGLICLMLGYCWMNRERILKFRRRLITGTSIAIPFLGIRVLYSLLSAYAPLTESISSDGKVTAVSSDSPLARFNGLSGSWEIYLFMSVLMEFIVVLIYLVVGLSVPLQNEADYARGRLADAWDADDDDTRKLKS